MRLDYLKATHPTYAPDVWRRYDALYRGGEAFRQCIAEFLPQNPEEPLPVYKARCEEARYFGYAGGLCDWFASKLLAAPFTPRAKLNGKAIDPPSFYAEFREDCDGSGTDLVDFMRERYSKALVKCTAWWCVEMPSDEGAPPVNQAEYEARGLGRAYVYPLETEQVLDWQVDHRGELLWAVVYDIESERQSIASTRGLVRETWRVYDREAVETFERVYDPSDPAQATPAKPQEVDVPSMGRRPHGFKRVPLVSLGFRGARGIRLKVGSTTRTVSSAKLEGFWLMNRLADPQIAHFRRAAALDWNLTRTCYAMPVFHLKNREPPVMGAGYYIALDVDEKVEWTGPPTAHLAVMVERVNSLKDEIYRVGNQMALGVENNAAAVGRSAKSKAVDNENAEVCLQVYGALCREAIERTYDLVAEGRGDREKWSIEGLDVFNLGDASVIVENATAAAMLNIQSTTFKQELDIRTASALLPGSEQAVRDKIAREIRENSQAEEQLKVENMLAGPDAEAPAVEASAMRMTAPMIPRDVAAAEKQVLAAQTQRAPKAAPPARPLRPGGRRRVPSPQASA